MRIPARLLALGLLLSLSETGFAASAAIELDEMKVSPNQFKEEVAVGPYGQPEWTTRRRFPSTRVYLQQPPGGMAVEQWWRGRFYEDGKSKFRFQTEAEIGLPHRFQLDLYENIIKDKDGDIEHEHVGIELRHALADWGVIPLNPTLYAEYKIGRDETPDVVEGKLLLGDDLPAGLHFGVNFVYERETSGEEAEELAASAAISRVITDRGLSAGVEVVYSEETVKGDRGNAEASFRAGPSLQWRPTQNTHVDVAPLFGLNDDAPDVEAYVVVGYDFGTPGKPKALGPTSLKSN